MLPQNAVFSDLSTDYFTVSFRKRHQKNRTNPQNMEEIRQQTATFRCYRDMLRQLVNAPLHTEKPTRLVGVCKLVVQSFDRGKLLNVLPLGLCRALGSSCGNLACPATDFFNPMVHLGSSSRPLRCCELLAFRCQQSGPDEPSADHYAEMATSRPASHQARHHKENKSGRLAW